MPPETPAATHLTRPPCLPATSPAEFTTLLKTNDRVPGSRWRWGQVRSSTGAALFEVDPATKGPSANPLVSNNPDFTSLHEVRAWESAVCGIACR